MRTFEIVLMGRSQLLRVNFDREKARHTDYEMRPTSIRTLFVPAESENKARAIAARQKRFDERITSVRW
jgi:hypothetical protein